MPAWTKAKLSNGTELIVSEKHDLPLVSFSLTFLGGSDQFETAERRGVGSLTASMMSEGTKTRNGDDLSNALQLLGTNVSISIASESGSISFVSTTAKFAATLDILADMLVNSTFPPEALERLRGQRLVALTQAKAQPGAIASRVFPRVLYGDAHPLGQNPTEQTIKAITRADVVDLHQRYFKPGRALVTVVGDITPAAIRPVIEKGLAGWAPGGEKPAFSFPPLQAAKATTIYLVDKPGAAQSTFAIGLPGPPRSTPDYFALQVMNTILGGMFQARLNANIREEKGYSYGVSSFFGFGKGPNPFRTGGDIVGDKTDAALVEFMKELRGILGERPVTERRAEDRQGLDWSSGCRGPLRRSAPSTARSRVCGCNRCPTTTISSTRNQSRRSRPTTSCASRRNTSIWIIWPSWWWEIARRSKRRLAQPRSRRSFTWISMALRSMGASRGYVMVHRRWPVPKHVTRAK